MGKLEDLEKKVKEYESEVAIPGWVVTFGDMMSLLLCFFVLIVSFSTIQEAAFNKAIGSLKGALSVLQDEPKVMIMTNVPVVRKMASNFEMRAPKVGYLEQEGFMSIQEEQNALKGVEWDKVVEKLKKVVSKYKGVSVQSNASGISVVMENPILFDTGRAVLKKEGLPLLSDIVQIISIIPNEISVEGHTDNIPINTEEFPSNWELSVARALSVLRNCILDDKIFPERMRAIGYGKFRPVSTNETQEGRSKNRRVEIILLKKMG